MSNSSQLLVTGSIATDYIFRFDGLFRKLINPKTEHLISLSLLSNQMRRSRGGTGANIAYSLGLLQTAPILLGSIGKEDKERLQKFEAVGVDITNVHLSKLETSTFVVFTDNEDSQIANFYIGAMGDAKTLTLRPFFKSNTIVIMGAHDMTAMDRQIDECKKGSLPLVFAVGQQVANLPTETLSKGVQNCTFLITNDYEFSLLAEKMNKSEKDILSSVPICVTTKGPKGSVIRGREIQEEIQIPAAKPTNVVDPTGAGDAYISGFFAGHQRGFALEVCGRMGSLAAVYVVEQYGTQQHVYTTKEFEMRYEENFNNTVKL